MKVFAVFKNADFTEGRGPMMLDKIFASESKACKYIDNQEGIFGAKSRDGLTMSEWIKSGKDGGWGGYEIKEIEAE